MKRWAIVLIPAVMIMVMLGYALGSRIVPQSALDNLANAAAPPDNGLPGNDVIVSADGSNVAMPASPIGNHADGGGLSDGGLDDGVSDMADNAAVPPPPPGDDTVEPDDVDAQARREISRAIRSATVQALDSGEPVHWRRDGLQGDIAVGQPSRSGDQTCRAVSATMGTEDRQQQSRDRVWCQDGDGGDWGPR